MAQTNFSGPVASENGFLDESAGKTDHSQFVGLESVINTSAGTWTRTRVAAGNYVLRHTAADDTTIIGIDISADLRTASDKGFRLDAIDVIYSVGTLALEAHTAALSSVVYANNTAVAVTSVSTTGSLATAVQANPYVSTLTVSSADFLNTADAKYVLELTVNAAATSAYDFYGLVLKFTRNDN